MCTDLFIQFRCNTLGNRKESDLIRTADYGSRDIYSHLCWEAERHVEIEAGLFYQLGNLFWNLLAGAAPPDP